MKKSYTASIILLLILIPVLIYFLKFVKSETVSAPASGTQGRSDNPYAASEYRYNMLANTFDSKNTEVDISKYRRDAIQYTKENNLVLDNDNSGIGWVALGPGNIGGRIRSILIHPTTTSTILIGAVAGGVWKTTNSGANWIPKLDSEDPISIGSLVHDVSSPDVVYAGSGEGWGNFDAAYGGGVHKSTDFGDTWTLLPSTIGGSVSSFRNVMKMAIDASGNVYAATKDYKAKHGVGSYTTAGGLFKSINGGTSWTEISSIAIDNYFNPTDLITLSSTEILYAVNYSTPTLGGIYRTINSGTNWTKMTSGLPSSGYRRIVLDQDPSDDDIIYAAFQSTDETPGGDAGLKGIFKSTNRGVDWVALTSPPKIASTGLLSYLSRQGWYDNVLEVDPYDPTNIYVGGVDMMKTTNTGVSWSQLSYWHSFYGTPVVHADHHAIAFDPVTAGVVYSGNDGGIYKSTDYGLTWTDLNNDLAITQYYSGAVYKTGLTFYGGTQDNGHLKFSSGTDWSVVQGGDGGYSAVDQTDPLVAYEEYVYLTIAKTIDGGATWSSATTGLSDAGFGSECLFIAPFGMSKENSDVLIAGSNELWLTTNGAASWTGVGPALLAFEYISAVLVKGTSAPFTAYAGTTFGTVIRCTTLDPSLGTSNVWDEITPIGINGAWVRRIGISPFDGAKVIACYSGFNTTGMLSSKHIWSSTNGGMTWSDISLSLPNTPVHSIIFDPSDAMTLWIGTEIGVFKSIDYGTIWINYTPGMPTYVPVDEMVLQDDTWRLFAFTHGRSAYVSDVALPVELASFAANVSENNVKLNWTTSAEINNSGFDIERKLFSENTGWRNIGFVNGNGTNNHLNIYSFNDHKLNSGKYNYRLKQIDFNGNYKYYNLETEVEVGVPKSFYLSQNYPNPFNPETNIDFHIPFDSKVILKIYDMSGREIKNVLNNFVSAGYHSLKLNFSELSSGTYFYRVSVNSTHGNYTESKKLLLIK